MKIVKSIRETETNKTKSYTFSFNRFKNWRLHLSIQIVIWE